VNNGPVLAVGGGNSGLQIAEERAASRPVEVSVGENPPMPPQRLLGRDLFWWLTRLGLMRVPAETRLGRRVRARGEFVIGTIARASDSGPDWSTPTDAPSDSPTAPPNRSAW
jgi:putative flavoprotein involved in K+ transport